MPRINTCDVPCIWQEQVRDMLHQLSGREDGCFLVAERLISSPKKRNANGVRTLSNGRKFGTSTSHNHAVTAANYSGVLTLGFGITKALQLPVPGLRTSWMKSVACDWLWLIGLGWRKALNPTGFRV